MTDASTFFSLPVGANPDRDQRVGTDELGRPVYRAGNGQQYALGETYRPQRETEAGSLARVRETIGNLIRGAVDSAVSGVTAPARAARGEPVTYGDALETAGMAQLGGAAMPAPRGALRSGALRMADDAAETPAQTVARLLREGRASEVTDDLMAQVDPQEMARLYESGATGMDMPLDEASRMARAREMGFDTDVYHGTAGDDFSAFRQGSSPSLPVDGAIWSSTLPDGGANFIAQSRAQSAGQDAGRVIPLRASTGRGLTVDASGAHAVDVRGVRNAAAEYDAVTLQNVREFGQPELTESVGVFDPTNIRSRFARFDPRLSHLANLNAANASPMTGLMGAQAGSRDEEIQRLAAYLAANGGLN